MSERRFDAIWRIESPKLIAALMRIVRDIDMAEELAQDAFVAALALHLSPCWENKINRVCFHAPEGSAPMIPYAVSASTTKSIRKTVLASLRLGRPLYLNADVTAERLVDAIESELKNRF